MDDVVMTRQSRIARGVLLALAGAWMLASPASTITASAQTYWSFQLEWEQAGDAPSYFQLCVNGSACTVLSDARITQGNVWRAALPIYPPGEYRLVLQACGPGGCVSGRPDLMIRVVAPSPRRPPIDIIKTERTP